MLSLKLTLRNKRGEIRAPVLRVAEALNVIPECLYPEQHYDEGLEKNKSSVELSRNDVGLYLGLEQESEETKMIRQEELEEESCRLDDALNGISPRDKMVLSHLYGLEDGVVWTVKAVAEKFDVSITRIAQVRDKAFRRVRRRIRM